MTPKKTALYDVHLNLGAKMVEFAGFSMPVRYTALTAEHLAVRNTVGVFDVSHMGEFIVSGSHALALLQRISSNDVSKLSVGQAQYSCMPNERGGIVDDLLIYKLEENEYMLVVNASNIEKDWKWITTQNSYKASMTNVSEEISLLAVQGPKTTEVLQALTPTDLSAIEYYTFVRSSIAGVDDVIISGTGYTGSGGFELYIPNKEVPKVWDALMAIKSPVAITPAGLGARDTLRLEMGYCLYGNDIDDTTSPIEAGLGWITKFNHDFVNAAFLKQQKEEGVSRRLCGFVMSEKGIPREGYDLLSMEGAKIGHVTSGTLSPSLGVGIGMGYVDVPHHRKDTDIKVQIRKKTLIARIARPPFYKPDKSVS